MGHYYDDQGRFAGLSYRSLPKSGDNPLIKSAQATDTIPLFSQQWQRTSDGIVEQVTEVDYQAKAQQFDYLYDSQYHLVSSTYRPVDLDSDFTQVAMLNESEGKLTEMQARYIYDELGNRLLVEEQSQTLKRYEYDNRGRLTTIAPLLPSTSESKTVDTQSISYNEAGQPTKYGDYQLSYLAGQLNQIKDKDGQLIAEYIYNNDGQRVKKTIYQQGNTRLTKPQTSYYVYEGSQLQHELDSKGDVIRHYVYIGNTLTAIIDYPKNAHGKIISPDKAGISLWERGSNWLSQLWGQGNAYPHINYVITDYLGRPRQVRSGESNELKWQLEPTVFGGDVDKALAQQNDYQLNVRFPGQYEDSETITTGAIMTRILDVICPLIR